MKQYEEIKNGEKSNSSVYKIDVSDNLQFFKSKGLKNNFKSVRLMGYQPYNENAETLSFKGENGIINNRSGLLIQNEEQSFIKEPDSKNLFRFFVKKGEHVYARPNDIIMIESCDHLVNVYLAFNDKLKKTIRANTLKDFLLQLPTGQFIRISRFCAINVQRLSGGNCKDQTFEFDFAFSVKLKHPISSTIFNGIGR